MKTSLINDKRVVNYFAYHYFVREVHSFSQYHVIQLKSILHCEIDAAFFWNLPGSLYNFYFQKFCTQQFCTKHFQSLTLGHTHVQWTSN